MTGPEGAMAPAPPADLRVLVVGRDDIERTLRRDPSLEVLRARTGTDAIGELALAAHDGDPGRVCVLLAPGVVEATEEPAWLDAMRRVDGAARYIVLGETARPGFDACLAPNAGPEELRRAVVGAATGATPETEPAPPPTPADAPESIAALPETDLVEASLRGEALLDRAVALLRRRPSLERAAFVAGADRPDSAGLAAAPVERRGARFGWLVGPAGAAEAMAEAAPWLASWLALESQRRQLQEAAFTDELTGAWNRRYFMRFLERALDEARAQRRDVTLMVYDIDDFKRYNDAFGHAAGDEILCETTRLLRSVIRPTDRVCRIGGDEFAVVFDDPAGPRSGEGRHPTSIAGIAQRFQQQICAHRFPKLGADAQGTLTISGGMATFPWDGHDATSLLERADALSLESKRQGKNLITLGPGAERVCGVGFGSRSEHRP